MQSKSQYFEAQQGLATCAQAQTYLSVSRSTLWRLERRGEIQTIRVGRALRFRWADLRRLAGAGSEK